MSLSANIRTHFVDWVELLSDVDAQTKYEKDVPFVPVYIELFETFNDLYVPSDAAFTAAFTAEEARRLADLNQLLDAAREKVEVVDIHSVAQLQALPEWQTVIGRAQELREVFRKAANQSSEPPPRADH